MYELPENERPDDWSSDDEVPLEPLRKLRALKEREATEAAAEEALRQRLTVMTSDVSDCEDEASEGDPLECAEDDESDRPSGTFPGLAAKKAMAAELRKENKANAAKANTAKAKANKPRRKLAQLWTSAGIDPAFTCGDGHTFNVSGGQVNLVTFASHNNEQAARLERVVGAPTALARRFNPALAGTSKGRGQWQQDPKANKPKPPGRWG
jgi:hypothetical protein